MKRLYFICLHLNIIIKGIMNIASINVFAELYYSDDDEPDSSVENVDELDSSVKNEDELDYSDDDEQDYEEKIQNAKQMTIYDWTQKYYPGYTNKSFLTQKQILNTICICFYNQDLYCNCCLESLIEEICKEIKIDDRPFQCGGCFCCIGY